MRIKRMLRRIVFLMLAVAAVFLAVALSHPELGSTVHIGCIHIGSAVWRVFYAVYVIVMAVLLVISFFIDPKGEKKK